MPFSNLLLTREGVSLLNKELENLKNIERPKVIQDIAEARSHGDLRENSEYTSAKEKQALIEGRINELESLLSSASVFDPETIANKKEIRFGANCVLINLKTKKKKDIRIVSTFEADIKNGLISIEAPFAKALLGKMQDEVVTVMVGEEEQDFKISSVAYQ